MLFALSKTECDHYCFHVASVRTQPHLLIITSSNLDPSFALYTALFPLEDEEGPGASSEVGAVELGPAVAVSAVVGPAEVDGTGGAAGGGGIIPKGTGKRAVIVASSIFLLVWSY